MQNYIKKAETTEVFLLKENKFLKQQLRHQQASLQNVESTVGRLSNQVAERPQGTLPSNTQEIGVSTGKGKEKFESTGVKGNDDKGKEKGYEPLKAKQAVPYPKTLRKDKLADLPRYDENVTVNIQITDVFKGMPNYGRFIKELISQRGKYQDETSFFIEEECNKIIESKLRVPKKLGDLGKFVFPCKFSDSEVFNAYADLGASIKLMPHSFYERLDLEPLKPTRIRIRLANHSYDTAIGIVGDILVSIDTLVFPVDFVITEIDDTYNDPYQKHIIPKHSV
ncbi:uncharacterized protein [Rutidosis leptorrhynchoides]|uniref:uncharacterized protein n=1 Tax=Rutidosis leptorrhynchoides TaxID=125765 RepID=UPI003A991578